MIITDLSKPQQWIAARGFNNQFTCTFTLSGSAFDISDYTFTLKVRAIGTSTPDLITLTEGGGLTNGGETGILTVNLTAGTSETVSVGSYFYVIEYDIDGLDYRLLHGTLDLTNEYQSCSPSTSVNILVRLEGTNVNLAVTLGAGAAGVESVTGDGVNNADPLNPIIDLTQSRTVTGADAIVQTDNLKTIYFNSASPFNFTIDQLTADTQVSFVNVGAGTVTFVNGAGVTYTGTTSLSGSTNATAVILYRTATAPVIVSGSAAGSFQPLDADLTAIAALTSAADKLPYATGAQAWALTDLTSYARTLLDDASAASARTTIGVAQFPYRSGRYYSNNVNAASTTTQLLANGTLRAWLWRVETALNFTEIISEVTTLAGSTSYRIGLYTDSGGYPNSLVSGTDVGTYDSTGNGVKTSGAVNITIQPGYYWIALNCNGTPALRAHGTTNLLSLGSNASMGANCFLTAISVALAYGAMPSTFTAGGTETLLACPAVGFKAA